MTVTSANDNSIAGGIPMNLEQMQEYLQDFYGIPIALRERGTKTVKCPYCLENHEHGTLDGHQRAGCKEGKGLMTLEIPWVHFLLL
jgi:hypothetical protein